MHVPGKTFQTSYILAINKTFTHKTPDSKILSINLRHSTAKNTTKRPLWLSHDTSREIGDLTDWWLQQQSNSSAFSIWESVSILQAILNKTFQVRVLTQVSFENAHSVRLQLTTVQCWWLYICLVLDSWCWILFACYLHLFICVVFFLFDSIFVFIN